MSRVGASRWQSWQPYGESFGEKLTQIFVSATTKWQFVVSLSWFSWIDQVFIVLNVYKKKKVLNLAVTGINLLRVNISVVPIYDAMHTRTQRSFLETRNILQDIIILQSWLVVNRLYRFHSTECLIMYDTHSFQSYNCTQGVLYLY